MLVQINSPSFHLLNDFVRCYAVQGNSCLDKGVNLAIGRLLCIGERVEGNSCLDKGFKPLVFPGQLRKSYLSLNSCLVQVDFEQPRGITAEDHLQLVVS